MQHPKTYEWHKIADDVSELSFSENGMVQLEVKGKSVCISKVKDEIFACAAKCPHAGGHLSAGYVDALGNIVCPLHRYKFSLVNGRNTSGEGYFLKTFPIEKRENGLFIGIETGGFLNWLK